jgi:hypothetical protein
MDKVYTEAEIEAIREKAYNDGASDAVSWLEEVYGEGIHETDAWKEYVGCDCHDDAEEEE